MPLPRVVLEATEPLTLLETLGVVEALYGW